MLPPLHWSRPANVPYPNVWLRFKAKDLDSDALVEYRIQDLAEDQFEVAIEQLTEYYFRDEPICKLKDVPNTDVGFIHDFQDLWRVQLAERMTLVCYKEGSDEIIGGNILYVLSKEDTVLAEAKNQSTNEAFKDMFDSFDLMYREGNFTVWEKYGVDKYLASFGLAVAPEYRGRGIGQRLLEMR